MKKFRIHYGRKVKIVNASSFGMVHKKYGRLNLDQIDLVKSKKKRGG